MGAVVLVPELSHEGEVPHIVLPVWIFHLVQVELTYMLPVAPLV